MPRTQKPLYETEMHHMHFRLVKYKFIIFDDGLCFIYKFFVQTYASDIC